MKAKRVIILFLCALLMSPSVSLSAGAKYYIAAPNNYVNTAEEQVDALYDMGLFKGTGTKTDGTAEFSLNNTATRNEGIVMLVRLIGKEKEALSQNNEHPFSDVPAWASPYVGYAFKNNLAMGISTAEFGGDQIISVSQYYTFLLRALGYSSGSDFKWNEAIEFGHKLSIYERLAGVAYPDPDAPQRIILGALSFQALSTLRKDGTCILMTQLVNTGAVSYEKAEKYGFRELLEYDNAGRKCYDGTGIPDFGAISNTIAIDKKEDIYFYRHVDLSSPGVVYGEMLEASKFLRDVSHWITEDPFNDTFVSTYNNIKYTNWDTGETVYVVDFGIAVNSEYSVSFGVKVGEPFTTTEVAQLKGYYNINNTQVFFPSELSETNVLSEQQVANYYADAVRGVKQQLKYPDMAKFDEKLPVIMSYEKDKNTLNLFGRVSASNALGVYSTVDYVCEFDLENNTYKTMLLD